MSDSSRQPPQIDLETVVAEISAEVGEAALLVGRGLICGYDGYDRVGVIIAEGCEAGRMVWDGYLPSPEDNRSLLVRMKRPRDAATQLAGALVGRMGRTTRSGRIDFFHADDWSFAWSRLPDPFALYTPDGRRAYVDGDELFIERDDADVCRWDVSAIEAVETCISADWSARSVAVVTRDTSVELIGETDSSARRGIVPNSGHVDDIHMGFQVMRFDTLTEDLADALEVDAHPYGDPKI